jgi:hypothetical protein
MHNWFQTLPNANKKSGKSRTKKWEKSSSYFSNPRLKCELPANVVSSSRENADAMPAEDLKVSKYFFKPKVDIIFTM